MSCLFDILCHTKHRRGWYAVGMKTVQLQYGDIDDASWPRGRVYLYMQHANTALATRLARGAVVQQLDEANMPTAYPGHTIVASGDNDFLVRAKTLALEGGFDLVCVPTRWAVEALYPYCLRLCPVPVAQALGMRTVVLSSVARDPADCADLYALLAACYVGLFDAVLTAMWRNENSDYQNSIQACRHALLTPEVYRNPQLLAHQIVQMLPHVSLQIEWFARLISLYKQQEMMYNKYRFAAAMGVAQAIALSPNLPMVALPPARTAVLAYLAADNVHPAIAPADDLARRDWIWQTARLGCHDYFAPLPSMCAVYRSLLPDCGYNTVPDLEAWDVAHLLPCLAEVAAEDSALGHLYRRGALNDWIDCLA